jgi:hypothetical protein
MRKVSDAMLLRMRREVGLLRAKNRCEYPRCHVNYAQLYPHHYFNKKNQSVRYDPLNCIILCAQHHTLSDKAAHLDPDWKEIWLASNKRPEGWLQELTERKNTVVKNNQFYKENWKINLKVELEKLKREENNA